VQIRKQKPHKRDILSYGKQDIDQNDIQAAIDVLQGDFLTTGPSVEKFEESLCAAIGAKYTIATSSATTALHLSVLALGLKEGDAAIVPSMTFLATANAIRYTGAEVIFADVNPDTGLMEFDHALEALGRAKDLKVKAVYPVHLTGQCVDLNSLSSLKKKGLSVVVDACHALGGTYDGKPVGSCPVEDMNIFSFHPVKMLTTGEGGAITTNNPDYANQAKLLRSHGMVKTDNNKPWHYEMTELGYNYRITDIQCAIGTSQIKKLESFVDRRKKLVSLYDQYLKDVSPHILPPAKVAACEPGWHLYSVRINFKSLGTDRATVMRNMQERGVGTQVHYIPVHTQPYYKNRYGNISLPGAEEYYSRTLTLPLFPSMEDEDVPYIVEALLESAGIK
jgi:UDP-4-amino-4,6-dideoxy-N-acetyl-beta-L-altrosamine transaminase